MKTIFTQTLMTAATLLVGLSLLPSSALAARYSAPSSSYGSDRLMIGLSAMKLDTSTSGPQIGDNDSATTIFDGKIGWAMDTGLYLGAIYNSRTDDSGGAKRERTGYGVTVGYHNSGWFLDGSYFISSTMKLPNSVELTGGSGFGVDLGHNFDLTENIYLGLQISYKSFSYSKANNLDFTNKLKSELMPMLTIGVSF